MLITTLVVGCSTISSGTLITVHTWLNFAERVKRADSLLQYGTVEYVPFFKDRFLKKLNSQEWPNCLIYNSLS